MRTVYLDHNATTPVRPEVLDAMLPYYREHFGNASSVHGFGRETRSAIEEAREILARALCASPDEIYFTSGGTESDNTALKGIAHERREKGDHIVTSQIEHHAILHTCQYLEQEGFRVMYLPVDRYGRVDPDDLWRAMTDRTILVSIMHANNEVGTIQPLAELGGIAKEWGAYFHTDAVQAFGKVPIDVDAMGIDALSLSGHKIYAPKGVGVLYLRKDVTISALMHGGHHERNRRAGTENVPGIVALGKATELALQEMDEEGGRLRELRDALQDHLTRRIERVSLNGHPSDRLSGTLNLSFEGVEGESLILSLDMEGIAVASGSACTAGLSEPSHVLTAMGIPPRLAESSLRFSLGRDNDTEDIEYVADVMPPVVERLRRMSVFE